MKKILILLCIFVLVLGQNQKPGRCPTSTGPGICPENCKSDQDCVKEQKCCSNNCGHICMDPAKNN
ncbi:unnamed protein product [Tenebrio molitor]|nr:unnamed protein product [Tenebrio molitor]